MNKSKGITVYFSDEERSEIGDIAAQMQEGPGTIVRTIIQDYFGFNVKPHVLAAIKKLVGKNK